VVFNRHHADDEGREESSGPTIRSALTRAAWLPALG
jgi:hypothetical protein